MYKIINFPSPEIMLTTHPQWGHQYWALCKLTKKHKNDECADCGLPVGDVAFRPITNKGNRMERICQRHLTKRALDASPREAKLDNNQGSRK